jgi:hypothetical protein
LLNNFEGSLSAALFGFRRQLLKSAGGHVQEMFKSCICHFLSFQIRRLQPAISFAGQIAEFGTLICCDLQNFFRQFSAAFQKRGWLKIAYQTQPLAGLSGANRCPAPCADSRHAGACSTEGHLHRSKARL